MDTYGRTSPVDKPRAARRPPDRVGNLRAADHAAGTWRAMVLGMALLLGACGSSEAPQVRGTSTGAGSVTGAGTGTGSTPDPGTGSGSGDTSVPDESAAPCTPGAMQAAPAVLKILSAGNRAEVQTKAFQLAFIDSSNRTVLAEVANTSPAPMPEAGSPTEILGGDTQPNPTLYAPMVFLVGTQQTTQSPGSIYGGNELGGVSSGVLYSATAVTGVQYCGAAAKDASQGALLTVSTNDPSGRLLKVTITPGAQGTIRVAAVTVAAPGQPEAEPVAVLADSFATAADEAFHGFGGRHNTLDERGLTFYNWIEQENFNAGPAQAGAEMSSNTQGYLFPNGPTAAYHVQSLFASSRPYAFLLNRFELTRFRLASDEATTWQVEVAANAIDYSVAFGDAPTSLAALTAITGRQRLPPAWSLSPIIDRLVPPFNSPSAADYEATVRLDIANFDRYHPPLSGYRIEGWARLTDDTLRELIGELSSRGIHTLL